MLKVGRYKSPDEHPFFPDDLPEPMLPPLQYPKVNNTPELDTKLLYSHVENYAFRHCLGFIT